MFYIFCVLGDNHTEKGLNLIYPPTKEELSYSVPCIAKLCKNYFKSRKKITGSLLVVHIQNGSEFHDHLLKALMNKTLYTIDMINQYSLCREECYLHFIEKAMNYFIAFSYLNEIHDAVRLWYKLLLSIKKIIEIFKHKLFVILGEDCQHGIHLHKWWPFLRKKIQKNIDKKTSIMLFKFFLHTEC